MQFIPTSLPEVILIEPKVYPDERGFYKEIFQTKKYTEAGLPSAFVQDNHSRSQKGVLRGMHYQIRQAQGKLVWVVVGEIFDVAVDLRRHSPYFGTWVSMTLSAQNHRQLYIPPGFAHGFYVLSDWAELSYKVTDFWAPEWERTLIWNDPQVGIVWPIPEHFQPILSAKDQLGKSLDQADLYD